MEQTMNKEMEFEGMNKTNDNLFFLSLKELNFIMLLEDIDEIPALGIMLDDMTEEEVKGCYESLQEKKLLMVNGNESEWKENFIAWFDVISSAKRHITIEGQNEKVAFFFLGESIVSMEIRNDEVSILWIPFIHIAIGQFLTFVEMSSNKDYLTATSVDEKDDEALTATLSSVELKDSVDLLNDVSQKMVILHGRELKEVVGDDFESEESFKVEEMVSDEQVQD